MNGSIISWEGFGQRGAGGVGHGNGGVFARGKGHCDSTVQLVGSLHNFFEFGPCVKGSLISGEGFRLREAGGMVWGQAGAVMGGSDERRVQRPALHHFLDFVEGAINIIVRSR